MPALKKARSLATRVATFAERKLSGPPEDFDPEFLAYAQKVRGYTSTSLERQFSLCEAVRFVVANRIPGSFVECGVWRGGSSLLAALTFAGLGDLRDIWMFDTFAGMTEPSVHDSKKDLNATATADHFAALQSGGHNEWCFSSLEDVRKCLARADYPQDKLHFIEGDVSETLQRVRPEQISILRLDTDFYESTKSELEHLWDRIAPGGLLIIDDYGSWDGARKAADEFFASLPEPVFLARVDYTARIAQKR